MEGAQRTDAAEVSSFIRAGEIVVARDDDDRVAGSIRVVRLGDGTGEFGMLVADPRQRGNGIGRDPPLEPLLATPCDFVIYRKDL